MSIPQIIEEYEKAMEFLGGCSDGNCVIVRPKGMHTNGGCKCYEDRTKARRAMQMGSFLYHRIKKELDHASK